MMKAAKWGLMCVSWNKTLPSDTGGYTKYSLSTKRRKFWLTEAFPRTHLWILLIHSMLIIDSRSSWLDEIMRFLIHILKLEK